MLNYQSSPNHHILDANDFLGVLNSRPPVSHLHLQPQFLVLFFHLSFDNEIISSVLKKTRRPFSKPVDQNFAAISI
ncbi:hypothetical protein L3X38_012750 [Prunus dulcis]|uniref:Uncharacterized protein n=1 Tax=Prunus dulcis TaxID=3755 RepID=A0AAD4ZGY0_PRUDU|nr:hypothetical protein L3X38_012750 [Prunus dulcis]